MKNVYEPPAQFEGLKLSLTLKLSCKMFVVSLDRDHWLMGEVKPKVHYKEELSLTFRSMLLQIDEFVSLITNMNDAREICKRMCHPSYRYDDSFTMNDLLVLSIGRCSKTAVKGTRCHSLENPLPYS